MSKYLGFPVTFGYMEQTTLPTGELYIHRGIDLGSFAGQRLEIAGVQVGITGQTGKAFGPHTHVQAGRDEWAQQTMNPAPYIGKPGTVVKVGYASEWGNYVCIKVGDVYVYYCHLQQANVRVGQVIKKEGREMVTQRGLEVIYRFRLGQSPTDYAKKNLLGKVTFDEADNAVMGSDAYKARAKRMRAAMSELNSHLPHGMRK